MSETATIKGQYAAAADRREAYIKHRIEDQIAYYEAKSAYNKKIYFRLSILIIIANAAIPVVSLYLPSGEYTVPKLIIACLSAGAAVLTSVLTLYGAKDLWSKYRTNASRLTAYLHQYYSASGPFAELGEEEAFRLLVTLCEAQMETENKSWETLLGRQAVPAASPQT